MNGNFDFAFLSMLLMQALHLCFHQIRIGLTGTILQNNLEELWCVMDWYVKRLLYYMCHLHI